MLTGTERHCINGYHSRVPMHFDLSPSLEKIKLTRMEKLICGVRVFVLVFMCYLLNQLFENNENVHKKKIREQ